MGMVISSYLTPVPPAEYEVDAGLLASYTGSGTWNNITTFPASGASQSAYNFTLDGNSSPTDNPVFNGVAGGNSSFEFFSDSLTNGAGRSFFDLASNTTFINTLHKSTGLFSWYGFLTLPTLTTTLFSTITSTATDIGVSLSINSNFNLVFTVGRGTTQQTVYTSSTIPNAPLRKCFMGLSYKASTGDGIIYFYGQVGIGNVITQVTESFTQTYTSPSASNATHPLKFYSGPAIWRSGMFNKALTANQFGALSGRYKSKLGF